MDSTQLSKFKRQFSNWYPFDEQGIENAPQKPGVYVIRKANGQRFGRLQGKSDVLYIGSCEAKKGIKQRLQQYLHPGPTQWTDRRINQLAKKYEMEVAWCLCDEPRNFEHNLLVQYLKDHDELPPLNRAGIRQLYKTLTEKIKLTEKITVTKSKAKQEK